MAPGCSASMRLQAEMTDLVSTPSTARANWRSDWLAGCEADVVIVGHTHVPLDRQIGSIRAINLGSVSNPVTPGLQATYVLLEADAQGYSIQLRRVEYDREAVIKAIEQARHPTPSF